MAALGARLRSLNDHCLEDRSGGLRAAAQGDLTVALQPVTTPLEVDSRDELGRLAETFNAMLAKAQAGIASYNAMRAELGELIGTFAETAGTVFSASQQMASTSDEAGRAVGEIAHAVGDVAQGAEPGAHGRDHARGRAGGRPRRRPERRHGEGHGRSRRRRAPGRPRGRGRRRARDRRHAPGRRVQRASRVGDRGPLGALRAHRRDRRDDHRDRRADEPARPKRGDRGRPRRRAGPRLRGRGRGCPQAGRGVPGRGRSDRRADRRDPGPDAARGQRRFRGRAAHRGGRRDRGAHARGVRAHRARRRRGRDADRRDRSASAEQVSASTQQTSASTHEIAEGDEMVYRVPSGTAASHVGLRLPIGASLSGRCVQEGHTLRCADANVDERVNAEACRRVGAVSMLCVPLEHAGDVVGVLKVYDGRPHAFGDEDVRPSISCPASSPPTWRTRASSRCAGTRAATTLSPAFPTGARSTSGSRRSSRARDGTAAGSLAVVERLGAAIEADPDCAGVGASWGIAALQPGDDAAALLARADAGLYAAKYSARSA